MQDIHTKLGLQQLHQDQQKLLEQNKAIAELLDKLNSKDFKTVLPDIFRVKADALPPVSIDGDVKAVVDGGSVTVLNLSELEQYFLGLQLALVETLQSPTPTNIVNAEPIPVSLSQTAEILGLLRQIADKDMQVSVDNKGVGKVTFPKRASDAIPVRLVTSDGKAFYTATGGGGGGGGGGVGIPDRLIDNATNRLRVLTEGINFTAQNLNVEADPPAINQFGRVQAVAPGATGTVVNIPSSAAGYRLRGFVVTGNGNGYIHLQVAGATILSGRIDNISRTLAITLPNPLSVTTGDNVALKVTNEAEATCEYEGTLLGA